MTVRHRWVHRSAVVGLATIALIGAGCSDDDDEAAPETSPPTTAPVVETTTEVIETTTTAAPAEITTVEIGAVDYGYEDVPAEIPAGIVEIELANNGAEEHQATLISVAEGSTLIDLLAQAATDPVAVLRDNVLAGGPNAVAPGATGNATGVLEPGHYGIVCLIPSPDGVPHAAKGMLAEFDVTGEVPEAVEVGADADVQVTLGEYRFVGAETLPSSGTIAITNEDDETHELAIYAPLEGQSPEQALGFFEAVTSVPPQAPTSPPPLPIGGIAPISPGRTQTIRVQDLPPGQYVLICFLPGADQPEQAHLQLGMKAIVTIE